MGQQEALTFLKENRQKWFVTKQIAEKLKVSVGSVTVSLKILRQSRQIHFKLTDSRKLGKRKIFAYKFKK